MPLNRKKLIDVYLDVSLKKYAEVIPDAGDIYSSIRLTIEEIEQYCKLHWSQYPHLSMLLGFLGLRSALLLPYYPHRSKKLT